MDRLRQGTGKGSIWSGTSTQHNSTVASYSFEAQTGTQLVFIVQERRTLKYRTRFGITNPARMRPL